MSQINNLKTFTGVLNHELIHAFHISQGLRLMMGYSYSNYTERIAYEYTYSIGLSSYSEFNKYIPPPYAPIMPPYLIPLP